MPIIRSLTAHNSAAASGNPVHDREQAIAMGYKGALISGADTFTYLTWPAAARWGRRWLEGGTIDCRLLRPVFDREPCDLVVDGNAGDGSADRDLAIELRVEGELRATATAALLADARPPAADAIPWRAPAATPPPLTADRLAIGTVLGSIEDRPSLGDRMAFVQDAGDDLPFYAGGQGGGEDGANDGGALLHPGYLVKLAMYTLGRNFRCDVLVHPGSRLTCYRPIPCTAALEARTQVIALYETRGHKAVYLDINILADGAVAATIKHKMIYQLWQKP